MIQEEKITEIRGRYNRAICFTGELEPSAQGQIRRLCDEPAFAGSQIRIMPDVHAGVGCTVGTTMTLTDRVIPALVGVDIGCGMETVELSKKRFRPERLDAFIRRKIPFGREVRKTPHPLAETVGLSSLRVASEIHSEYASLSLGSLGGGNHFIEIDRDEEENLYLVIHSGSRYLGKEVATLYQEKGYQALLAGLSRQRREAAESLKEQGRTREIQGVLAAMKKEETETLVREMAFVTGTLFEDYLHDMKIVQKFAACNRRAMAEAILGELGGTAAASFTTIHNYIDTDAMILRKGAVSAQAGERLLIPMNMRDGALLCRGRGNGEWNCSAPHGAGRRLSRGEARSKLSVEKFRRTMNGIYSSCVGKDTLDESPMAYKDASSIESAIAPTVEILAHLTPLYNFKAGG